VEALVAEFAAESGAKVDANRLARMVVAQIHGLSTQFKVDRNVDSFESGICAVTDVLAGEVARAPRASQPAPTNRMQILG
jgi:hypothetical protein